MKKDLKTLIKESNYKGRAFEEALGIKKTAFHQLKTGKRKIKNIEAKAIAEMLNISPVDVIEAWVLSSKENTKIGA